MAKKDNSIGAKKKAKATAQMQDKVDVLASFVEAGGVPDGYDFPGWNSVHKKNRIEEGKQVVLTGTESFRFWHDPDREFKVKGRTVKGVHKIGSPSTLTANDDNRSLTAQAEMHIKALEKIANTSSSEVIAGLELQLEAMEVLLQDMTNQVAAVGFENKKLTDKVARLQSDYDKVDGELDKARDEIRQYKGTRPIHGGKGTDDV